MFPCFQSFNPAVNIRTFFVVNKENSTESDLSNTEHVYFTQQGI